MFRRRELDAPDQFEEMCRQSFDRMSSSFRGKSDAEIQSVLMTYQKNSAIYPGLLFWILVDSEPPERLFQHVRNITIDNFVAFCSLLQTVCEKKFSILNTSPLKKLLFVVDELLGLEVAAVDPCLAALCRQIPSGNSSPRTLANLTQIFNIVKKHRTVICTRPTLLSTIMYHFARFLPEIASEQKMQSNLGAFLSQSIIDFPNEWQAIGRDAVRVLLLNVNSYPPLKSLCDSSMPMLEKQTPASFLQSRLTPDMEEKITFVLSEVALGSQQRYLTWFMTKFIRNADTIVFDLIRYLCSVGRQKLPSWVILGWLVKTYQQSNLISQITRCILFDLIFHRPNDDPQRLEPGFLLMLNSVRGYQDVTQLLLETLIECAQSFQPSSLRPQIRSSIETGLIKAATAANVQSLSPLFITPALRNSLVGLFPRAFSPTPAHTPPSSPSPSPSLKRTPSPASSPPPAKIAKSSSDPQSLLSRILSRLPVSLKEAFTNLFVALYNNEPPDDPERHIANSIGSINSYVTSNGVSDDVLQQVILPLAELLKRQLCTGVFRPSRALSIVFTALRDSSAFLAQLRSAEVQFGFHMLDWARASPANRDAYIQMITVAGCSVSDDIAVCRTTCPLHTSTLLLYAFEDLLKYCSDAAIFSYLITSCSPSELSGFSGRIATSKASLVSPDFSDSDKVRVATAFSSALCALPHFQQTLGWIVLSNALSLWKSQIIFEFTEQYLSGLGSKSLSCHESEGLSTVWKAVSPSEEPVTRLSRLPTQFQESFIDRVALYWFVSHPTVVIDVIYKTISFPHCKVFLKAFSQVARNPDRWSDLVDLIKGNVSLLEMLSSSELYQDDCIRRFCEELLGSNSISKAMSNDIDQIDMDGWASFAST